MLKKILFDLTPAVAESVNTKQLFHTLKSAEIDCELSSSSDRTVLINITNPLTCNEKDYLMVTDSSSGIASARNANIPCIGYAPPESTENMSGAYALFEDFASVDVGYLCRTHAHAAGYPAEILSTEHLVVQEFSDKDFPTLYSMCTEPSSASFMEEVLSDYETEQEKHNSYIRNIYPFFDLALWGVFEKISGKLIGRAGFSLPEDDSDTFSIGYLIDVPYRRQGYARELIPALLSYAKEQGYSEVSARIKQGNIASVKALEQCGFSYERTENSTEGIISYLIHLTK